MNVLPEKAETLRRKHAGAEVIPEIRRRASVFVLPSLSEGLPRALLEAMSCGKPVVASDIPGVRSVVKHQSNGLLVPPANPQALAEAITVLLRNRDMREKFGRAARRVVLGRYNWEVLMKKLDVIYHEVS